MVNHENDFEQRGVLCFIVNYPIQLEQLEQYLVYNCKKINNASSA